jgi:peptidoglycan/xylan/chitin deacetylase (PgdA/CDA1 family)
VAVKVAQMSQAAGPENQPQDSKNDFGRAMASTIEKTATEASWIRVLFRRTARFIGLCDLVGGSPGRSEGLMEARDARIPAYNCRPMNLIRRPALRQTRRRVASIFAGTALLALLVAVGGTSPATATGGGTLVRADVSQAGRLLIVQVRTRDQIALNDLARQPDFNRPAAKYLCLEINRAGHKVISRICLGGQNRPHHVVGVSRTLRSGKVISKKTVQATVTRVKGKKLVFSFQPGAARLVPGRYSWRAALAGVGCPSGSTGCHSYLPADRRAGYEIKPIIAVGCTGGNGQVVRRGPAAGKRVALTFDDGPSAYTPGVLRVLRKKKVKATFFMLGQRVNADPSTARRVLAAGHEIGNHSNGHAPLPGRADIRYTSSLIRSRTGFRPCLFRPPYGAISGSVVSGAKSAGMKTVLWDVDTSDWSTPGSGSIAASIRSARAGSIVLMHDGGGPRGQTIAALPGAIRSLRSRGYRFATVSRLLGNRTIYRPVR